MAHGFLSYQDTRGEVDYLGGIVNAVKDYLDNREKKEQVADMVAAKINVEDKETAALEAGKSAPRLPVGAQKMLTGGSYSKLVGRNPKALPGAVATNPEVRGGAITRMGFGGKRLKPEGFVGDQIIDISATPVNDSNQIVQAIDRLTFVSMNLLSATKEQTAIAQRQQLFFEKLARKDKSALEEAELERGKDLSGNSRYQPSKLASGAVAGLLPPSRGDTGDFLKTAARVGLSNPAKGAQAIGKGTMSVVKALDTAGLKGPAKLTQSLSKRLPEISKNASKMLGGAATPKLTKEVVEAGVKGGSKALSAAKIQQKALAGAVSNSVRPVSRTIGKGTSIATTIPREQAAAVFAQLSDAGIPEEKIMKEMIDTFGKETVEQLTAAGSRKALKSTGAAKMVAGLAGKGLGKSIVKKIPVIAGLAGIAFGIQRALEGDFFGAGLEVASGLMGATGVGAGASLGIDGFLLARDLGMTPFASGGIITQPTAGLVGEAGTEGVFPLEGTRGRKTFEMFGNAFVDAQKRRIREVAQIQSAGLEEFAKKKDNGFFSWLFGGGNNDNSPPSNNGDGRAAWDIFGWFTGNRNQNPEVRPQRRMIGPPPPVTGSGDLFDVIASGEGGYESVNRGVAGDTPGGAESVFGKKLSDMTVGEVMQLQAEDKLFAVGKYQIIPKTMRGFVRTMKISMDDKFDAATQEKFKKYVIDFKRPTVGRYLRGETNDRAEAAQELAREFASIGLSYDEAGRVRGESRYSGSAGNAASISPEEIEAALDRGRVGGLSPMGDQSSLTPSAAEDGTPLSAASQQVATAAFTPQAAPIIQNFYGSDAAKSSGGNMPATVAFGISSRDTGTDPFAEFRIRSLA